jgi:hypothetical protein
LTQDFLVLHDFLEKPFINGGADSDMRDGREGLQPWEDNASSRFSAFLILSRFADDTNLL